MFDNSRYLTKGINKEVPLNLQALLWSMIDSTLIKKDYLQVFKIKIINKNANLIEITHTQEQPKYKNTIQAVAVIERDLKIYVIDDGENMVMLQSNEY